MDDLLAEFLTETGEGLGELDTDLVKLEKHPNDKDLLSKIFRIMHTIKGTCGFLGLPRLELVAHNGENVMVLFRDGDLEVTPEYVTLIFEALDRVRLILKGLEKTGKEPEGDDSELIEKLALVTSAVEGDAATKDESEPVFEPVMVKTDGKSPETEDAPKTDIVVVNELSPDTDTDTDTDFTKDTSIANQSLRVNVSVLENLMTLVSELVLTRNQLLQIQRKKQNGTDYEAPLLVLPGQRAGVRLRTKPRTKNQTKPGHRGAEPTSPFLLL